QSREGRRSWGCDGRGVCARANHAVSVRERAEGERRSSGSLKVKVIDRPVACSEVGEAGTQRGRSDASRFTRRLLERQTAGQARGKRGRMSTTRSVRGRHGVTPEWKGHVLLTAKEMNG